jgi:hypothetical protein
MALFSEEEAGLEQGQRPDALDGNSTEDTPNAIEGFLRTVQKLTSMGSLEVTKKDSVPSLCTRCQKISSLSRPSKLMWREVEDGASRLECPLCQLIVDCLPEAQNMNSVVFKVGLLDGMWFRQESNGVY